MPSADQVIAKRSAISLGTRIKWLGFRFIEWLSDLRGNTAVVDSRLDQMGEGGASIWVFVSTIGELNAIDPFLQRLVTEASKFKLVLITDHPHYIESYQRRYPQAFVQVSRGHSDDARQLAQRYPPTMLVVGEIPCWPGDAPCRFSFAYVIEAKRLGARTCIVNGWLYHYQPSCRMDALERQWFQESYLKAFDLIAVQTEEVREALIAHGAVAANIHVVGNLKFDALPSSDWSPAQARSPKMLSALLGSGRPIIVAGCVTEYADQHFILDAFQALRAVHPEALLIIAPRHPEVTERMQALSHFLDERRLPAEFRSKIEDEALSEDLACLILDTIGELKDFYAASRIAHVGVDHNVLEPLGFGKPVTVQSGWNQTYPSYPVYVLLRQQEGLTEVNTVEELAAVWSQLLLGSESYCRAQEMVRDVLESVRGSVDRHWSAVLPLMVDQR